jgi:hypothetical protein
LLPARSTTPSRQAPPRSSRPPLPDRVIVVTVPETNRAVAVSLGAAAALVQAASTPTESAQTRLERLIKEGSGGRGVVPGAGIEPARP